MKNHRYNKTKCKAKDEVYNNIKDIGIRKKNKKV